MINEVYQITIALIHALGNTVVHTLFRTNALKCLLKSHVLVLLFFLDFRKLLNHDSNEQFFIFSKLKFYEKIRLFKGKTCNKSGIDNKVHPSKVL